jgi:hypothetical protein
MAPTGTCGPWNANFHDGEEQADSNEEEMPILTAGETAVPNIATVEGTAASIALNLEMRGGGVASTMVAPGSSA